MAWVACSPDGRTVLSRSPVPFAPLERCNRSICSARALPPLVPKHACCRLVASVARVPQPPARARKTEVREKRSLAPLVGSLRIAAKFDRLSGSWNRPTKTCCGTGEHNRLRENRYEPRSRLLTAKQALTLDAIDCLMPNASNLEMTVVRPQRRSLTYRGSPHDHSRPRNEF